MPMNTVIRDRRKTLGLTQEQVADYLGVSAPAVNKWEKGASSPDVSLLPALARLLEVDLNTLFCFQDGLSDQEISAFSSAVGKEIKKNGMESGFQMCVDKIQEYPNCSGLIHTAALVVEGSLLLSGLTSEEKGKYEKTILSWYDRVANSGEEPYRTRAAYMLASKYILREEYKKAQEMLDLLPEADALDKKKLQADLYIRQNKLEEAGKILERKLVMALNELQVYLMNLVEVAFREGREEDASKLAEAAKTSAKLFGLSDYNANLVPFQLATAKKDVPGSLSLIRTILTATLVPWDTRKIPLYHHISDTWSQAPVSSLVLAPLLSDLEHNPKYEYLKDDPEFLRILKAFRAKC